MIPIDHISLLKAYYNLRLNGFFKIFSGEINFKTPKNFLHLVCLFNNKIEFEKSKNMIPLDLETKIFFKFRFPIEIFSE